MSKEEAAKPKPHNDEAGKEPLAAKEVKSKFSSFISHPIVIIIGLIGAIASLVGIPLNIYVYYAAKAYPELTYYVNPVKTTIVRAGEASKLSASFENKPITTDVTATQVAIWNQGRQAIKKEQVLKPVVIYTDNNTPILEATLRKPSRDVTQLSLNTDELQKGRVTILWDILEQNDGAVIQLVYAGNTSVRIQADGVIEGQPRIEQIEFSGKIKSPNEQYESERWNYRSPGYLLTTLGIVLLAGAAALRKVKADTIASINSIMKAEQSLIDFYSGSIKFERDMIEQNDRFIADAKEQSKKYENEEYKEIAEFSSERIAGYRKDQQRSRDRIKNYELMIEKEVAEQAKLIQNNRKKERLFDLAIIGAILLALLVFIPAIYLLFFAQPLGPPFSF